MSDAAVIRIDERQAALTPVELLRIAVTQGADIDKLKQLMDLQERWEKNEARKAFVASMNKFKASPPIITKNKHVKYPTRSGGTPVDYHHATLDHVCDEVTKGLSAVGITHAWKVAQDKDLITVTCILTHEMGHSEETHMQGLPDTSGDKSPIKALGSTVTYLQRYTLLAACGLAAKNEDNETENGGPLIEAAEVERLCKEISAAKDAAELKYRFSFAYGKAQEINDRKAMTFYIQAKDKRKQEIERGSR